MDIRYERNMNSFTEEEILRVHQKSVIIIGLGGLGGYVAQCLARFGVKKLTLIDGDSFSESNLNRQLFAAENNLGHNKAEAAKKAITAINSSIDIIAVPEMLTEQNSRGLINCHHIAIDCLDNIPARFVLSRACDDTRTPLVHGAIGGFYGQVSCIYPGEKTMDNLYGGADFAVNSAVNSIEKALGNPAFTPQIIAGIQASEALKILAGRDSALSGKCLRIDLLDMEFDVFDLS